MSNELESGYIFNMYDEGFTQESIAAALDISRHRVRQALAARAAVRNARKDPENCRIFVIGDTHAEPDTPMERFTALGRLFNDVGQKFIDQGKEVIAQFMGDHWDMPSLNYHTKGSKARWNQTFERDVRSGEEAFELVEAECEEFWNSALIGLCYGNHDQGRIESTVKKDPSLFGTVDISRLDEICERFGIETVPYRQAVVRHGIAFSHNLFKSGKPVSSVNQARALVDKAHMSIVVGHHHTMSMHEDVRPDGTKLTSLIGGCFKDKMPAYAGLDVSKWFNGVILIAPQTNGGFSVEQTWTRERLKEMYGV